MKKKLLTILYTLWSKVLPILLIIGFFIGILFNLWKIQMLPLWLSIVISIISCGLTVFGFGKLIKLW